MSQGRIYFKLGMDGIQVIAKYPNADGFIDFTVLSSKEANNRMKNCPFDIPLVGKDKKNGKAKT